MNGREKMTQLKIINLTPHKISIFKESDFKNLKQINPTTWTADSVQGVGISFESQGVARIQTTTKSVESQTDFELVKTEYGDLEGIPDGVENYDIIIVSLPTKSNAATSGNTLAEKMVSPYKVVRDSENGSIILGCMGLTY